MLSASSVHDPTGHTDSDSSIDVSIPRLAGHLH